MASSTASKFGPSEGGAWLVVRVPDIAQPGFGFHGTMNKACGQKRDDERGAHLTSVLYGNMAGSMWDRGRGELAHSSTRFHRTICFCWSSGAMPRVGCGGVRWLPCDQMNVPLTLAYGPDDCLGPIGFIVGRPRLACLGCQLLSWLFGREQSVYPRLVWGVVCLSAQVAHPPHVFGSLCVYWLWA